MNCSRGGGHWGLGKVSEGRVQYFVVTYTRRDNPLFVLQRFVRRDAR